MQILTSQFLKHLFNLQVLVLQLRKPKCSAILRNTGNITCTGCDNEASAYKAARRIVRIIQRAGYRDTVQLRNFRINNIHATTAIPSNIDLLAIKRDTPDHETYIRFSCFTFLHHSYKLFVYFHQDLRARTRRIGSNLQSERGTRRRQRSADPHHL